jgi:hypothetical protein
MTMSRLHSVGITVSALCAVTAALAADGAKPDSHVLFAFDPNTGWVLDRKIGPDDLIPPKDGGPGPVTFDKAHPYYPNNTPGRQSSYRVADLNNPILQEWTKPSMKKANDAVIAGKVPFRARERCWPVGVPGFDAYSLVEPFYFYERPNEIVVINQGGPEIRHIYMNVPHSKNLKPTWYGESVGHYEGNDTLVIDTIGLNDKTFTDNYRTPHTTQIHVIERWKLAADKKTVDVSLYVEDPGAFTTPWRAIQRWVRVEDAPILQVPCNENNGDFFSHDLVPLAEAKTPDF